MHIKKILSLFLIVALLFGMISFSSTDSYAESGTNIKMTLSPATEGKYTYYTNELTEVNLDLDLSGFDSSIQNADLVITVPKEYLEALTGSPIVSATGPTEIETADGKCQLIYHFSKLTGGTSFQIPFRVQTQAGTTPGNYVLPINASLIASDGTTLVAAQQIDFKQIVREPNIIKICNGKSEDGTKSYGGQGAATDSNIIEPGTEFEQVFWAMIDYPRLPDPAEADTAYLGVRKYEKIIVTDTLPVGAVFEQSRNPTWTYDAANRTVSYVIDSQQLAVGIGSENLQMPALKLIFPNGDTRLQYKNTMQAEFVPENKQSYEGENVVAKDSIMFGLTTNLPTAITATKMTYESTFYDQISSKTTEKTWYCHFSNPSKAMNLENIVLEDYKLDTRMKYVSAQIWGGIKGTFTLESIDAEGNVTTISSGNMIETGAVILNIPSNAVSIRVKTNEGSYVSANDGVDLKVVTQLRDPENVHFDAQNSSNNIFSNSLKVSGTYVGTKALASGSTNASMRIMKYAPKADLSKYCSKASLFVGEKANFTLVGNGDQMLEPDTIQGGKLIDFLPPGMEYVNGSTEMTGRYAGLLVSLEPTIKVNYKGTGQTALIWEFANPLQQTIPYFYVYYSAVATKNMMNGISTNTAYWIWDNNGSENSDTTQVAVSGGMTGDLYDFDGDGNLTEKVAVAKANVAFVAPKEVVFSKYVKGSLDSTDTLTGGRTEVGAEFSYKLALRNYSLQDVKQLTAIEVLPYVGDKAIVANEAGDYIARNSEFAVQLTGAVVPPVGYTVYYTLDQPKSDSESSPSNYAASANWVPENMVSDWSVIHGIKIVMNAGVLLPASATVSLSIPVKTPTDMSLTNGELAFNTFAASTNGGNDFLEANVSSVMAVSYQVTGTAFVDKDKDGALGSGETGLSGLEVWLFNEDGTPALDLDGNPIKSTTKEDGTYQLNAYNKGTYYVKVSSPDDYITTDKGDNNNKLASHVSTTTGNTDTFDLTVDANAVVRNAGYYANTGDLTIKKLLLDRDGNAIDETREFTILVTGPSYPDGKEMTLSNKTPLILEHLEFGTYEVKELDASAYEVTISGTDALSYENQTGEITVQNKEKTVESASLDIEKIIGETTSNGGSHNGGTNNVIGMHGAATPAIGKTAELMPNVDETFTFELTPNQGAFPMPHDSKVTIDGAGTASFGTWSYTKPGDYIYQVQEVAGDDSHYTYDKTIYTITDTVTLNDAGDLEVNRTITKDGEAVSGTLTFTNQFTAKPVTPKAIDIQKIVKGTSKTDETFTFQLTPEEGLPQYPALPKDNIQKQEIKIDGPGKASFDTWSYTLPGVYTYQVKEAAGDNSYYTYDKTVYTITDTVTLNDAGDLQLSRVIANTGNEEIKGTLTFENQFSGPKEEFPNIEKPEKPNNGATVNTGDQSNPFRLLLSAILCLAVLVTSGMYTVAQKRKTNKRR